MSVFKHAFAIFCLGLAGCNIHVASSPNTFPQPKVVPAQKIESFDKFSVPISTQPSAYKSNFCNLDSFAECTDLNYQFLPTMDQYKLGAWGGCYSYTATQIISAALYRSQGARINPSPEYLAMKGWTQEITDTHDWTPTDSRAAKLMNRPGVSLFTGGSAEKFSDFFIKLGHFVERSEFETIWNQFRLSEKAIIQRIRESQSLDNSGEILESTRLISQLATDHLNQVQSHKLDFKEDLDKLRVNRLKISDYAIEFIKARLQEGQTEEIKNFQNIPGVFATHADVCGPTSLNTRHNIETLKAQIDSGIPVVVALFTSEMLKSNDGGKTWEKHVSKSHGKHSMILTGYHKDGNDYYWHFRNTWAEGNEEQPLMSLSKFPFSETCRIYRAFTVIE